MVFSLDALPVLARTSITVMLLAAVAAMVSLAQADASPPNVIVILADDLGGADLGCMGSTFHETPCLDRLASEGMRFTHGYAAHPFCSPTRAALLTGRAPARLKITDFIPSNTKTGRFLPAEMAMELPLDEVTLAESLHAAGYATWHVGKWHLGRGPDFLPEHQGYDVNIAGTHSGLPPSYFWPYGNNKPALQHRYHGFPVPGLVEGGRKGEHLCDRLTTEAIRLIDGRDPSRPFFLSLPYYDVHTPIEAKPELVAKYRAKAERLGLPAARDAPRVPEGDPARGSEMRQSMDRQCNPTYAAMVETLDTNVGRLLDAVAERGLAGTTLVVFTSDNGGLNEHNAGSTPITSNSPLRAGKGWLYEGGVRVPWIVRLPGVVAPGSVSDVPIISTDLAPTVLDVCGLAAEPGRHLDGRSFRPLLEGRTEPIHEELCWHFPHYGNTGSGPCGSIRSGDWKLIEWFENDSVELFNLATDPGERTDVAAAHPAEVARLRDALRRHRAATGANMLRPKP